MVRGSVVLWSKAGEDYIWQRNALTEDEEKEKEGKGGDGGSFGQQLRQRLVVIASTIFRHHLPRGKRSAGAALGHGVAAAVDDETMEELAGPIGRSLRRLTLSLRGGSWDDCKKK